MGSPPREEPKEVAVPSNKVRVAHAVRIDSLSKTEVWVQKSLEGLAFLQALDKPHLEKGLLMANGVADPLLLKPFRVRFMNLSGPYRKGIIGSTTSSSRPVG